MIAYLKGKIHSLNSDHIILDVNGVGYKIESYAPFRLGLESADTQVFVHTWLRERELRLFGFSAYAEQLLFERLLTVSGVGPKAAMLLVSQYSVGQILAAVEHGDADVLKVKGVGSKTLAKIVIELRGKLTGIESLNASTTDADQQEFTPRVSVSPSDELSLALDSLGFKPADYEGIVKQVERELPFAEQIKAALKLLRPPVVE